MLISAVMHIMSMEKLPHGQYGYSGHVVNLPQDVASFALSLPRLPSNLEVMIVRKEGANQTHSDVRVRRRVVERTLPWLITNNRYYQSMGITLDTTALEQLPEDGSISHLLPTTENYYEPATPPTSSLSYEQRKIRLARMTIYHSHLSLLLHRL